MLCQFSFKNFKSYRDNTVFDLQATDIKEFSDSLLSKDSKRFSPLLPVAVIYGPNAGGKSGVLEALVYLISRVILPLRSTSQRKLNPFLMALDDYSPFLFDEVSSGTETSFELYFRTKTAEFRYALSQLGDTVLSESLYRTKLDCTRRCPVMIFDRNEKQITPGSPLKLKKVNISTVNPVIPFLSFLAINYDIPCITDVIKWFSCCCSINYAKSGRDYRILLPDNPATKNIALSIMERMDLSISDYIVNVHETDTGAKTKEFSTIHTINSKNYTLPLDSESQGTIKILSFLPSVIFSLLNGSLTVVDELDAKLHPQLLRSIVELYTNPSSNPNGAQLVFTSHDLSIMRSDLLRRDEIWFAAKKDDNSSELWSLYEIRDERGDRIKVTAAYDKQYWEGRYGADPYLREMMDWRLPNEHATT